MANPALRQRGETPAASLLPEGEVRVHAGSDPYPFLLLLLLADVAFVMLHILHTWTGLAPNPMLSIERDRGHAEIFQYLKEYWIASLLVLLAVRRQKLLYLSWAPLFAYFLLDDSLKIHEKLGAFVSYRYGFDAALGVRSQDLGELVVTGFFGVLLFSLIGAAHYLSGPVERRVSRQLLLLVAALVFFGIGVDLLKQLSGQSPVRPLLGMLEDAGEMIVMSVIAWFVFRLVSYPTSVSGGAVGAPGSPPLTDPAGERDAEAGSSARSATAGRAPQ